MGIGGGGGSQTQSTTVPAHIREAAMRQQQLADAVNQIGFVPYAGPEVAAFTPQQMASFQGTNDLAAAFGMPTAPVNMPAPQDFGGILGYSSLPMLEQAQAAISPEQRGLLDGGFLTLAQPPAPAPKREKRDGDYGYSRGVRRAVDEKGWG